MSIDFLVGISMEEGKGKEGEGERRREKLEWKEESLEGRGGEEGRLGVDGLGTGKTF